MPSISRRNLLLGAAIVGGIGVLMMKPSDKSGPRDTYFLDVQKALLKANIAEPRLVIDRTRLNANIDTLLGHLPDGMGYRIVAKSLPSLALIQHIAERTKTDRLMTFNQPMLSALSLAMPQASQLLGKPLPVQAARNYFKALPASHSEAADNIQWLIDTPQRLVQYQALSTSLGRKLRINIELDVGLHRGGFEPGEAIQSVLDTIKSSPDLELAGLMGYEPHIPSLPTAMGWRDKALKNAWRIYTEAKAQVGETFGADHLQRMTLNAAGSPTYRLYKDTSIANEVSVGSTLVKPTHFDKDLLEEHAPASFIATPVIKFYDDTKMPGLEFADGVKRAWDPNYQRTVFIYGGNWLADPVDPPGLAYNSTFGRSSNQEMLNGGPELEISPDEFVFFRPHQSEAVFLQFGDIAVYENGEIVDQWPVFPASA